MAKTVATDFLTPGVQQVRKSIRDIDDSYNNAWDILAELCQNAVDALRKAEIARGQIEIVVDAPKRLVQVTDDGVGIEPERLPVLLKPFSTDKDRDETSVGEKGVGLTFVMFSCNDFRIRTGTASGGTEGRVANARNWKSRMDDAPLDLETSDLEPRVGTEVRLADVDDGCPVFTWTFEQLMHILRTRTAIGNTNVLWGEDIEIDVTVRHCDQEGTWREEDRVPFAYRLPHEGLGSESVIDLDEFEAWTKEADRTDIEKRRKLQDKVITHVASYTHTDNRIIRTYTCYVPKRKSWKDLTRFAGIAAEAQLESPEWQEEYGYLEVSDGIFTSVKGMPTGIEVGHPSSGYAGYWPNVFMLFEDRKLGFDIGRKSIHGRQAGLYKRYAKEIFNDFLKYVTRYVSGDVSDGREAEWDKDQAFDDIARIPDLGIAGYSLRKTPKDQEAGVVGLFFEAIGRGVIKDIEPLVTGYKNKYDMYALLGKRRVVIEFKSRLAKILKDFDDERKMFDEIDAIVAWDISEDDVEAFRKQGIALEPIANSVLGSGEPKFPHATHELRLPNVNPVLVIDLKKVLGARPTQ